jgi:hypothetical protein
LNREGNTEIPEKEISEECDPKDPDQEPRCERRKKELSNLILGSHRILAFLSHAFGQQSPPHPPFLLKRGRIRWNDVILFVALPSV